MISVVLQPIKNDNWAPRFLEYIPVELHDSFMHLDLALTLSEGDRDRADQILMQSSNTATHVCYVITHQWCYEYPLRWLAKLTRVLNEPSTLAVFDPALNGDPQYEALRTYLVEEYGLSHVATWDEAAALFQQEMEEGRKDGK